MEYRAPREIPTYVASGRERLSHLAKFLDGLQPERLTLTRWYGDGVGCAVGLAAALDPWFRAQGVRLADEDDLKHCRPVFQGKTDWRAVASFFQIGLGEAAHLFHRRSYGKGAEPHPSRMAARIRAYLASTGLGAGHGQETATPGLVPPAGRPSRPVEAGARRALVDA